METICFLFFFNLPDNSENTDFTWVSRSNASAQIYLKIIPLPKFTIYKFI